MDVNKMELLLYPDAKLTNPNLRIDQWLPEYDEKIKKMFDIMYQTKGIGLAAPQVGWDVQLFVYNITGKYDEKDQERIIFNPSITTSGDETFQLEGCLSFPGVSAKIKRWSQVHLVGETPNGKIEEDMVDLQAIAMQHEVDHLNGLLFIERMNPAEFAKNRTIINKLKNRGKNDK
jgi:peptide deformylase